MKRYLLRVCSALLAACCLLAAPGCAKPGTEAQHASLLNPKNPTAITVWTYYNGPQKLAFDALVLQFNESVGKERGIAVESISHSNVNELTDQVLNSVNKKVGAAELPQIFAAYADTAFQVDQLGFVASLDSYLTPEELAEYVPGYIDEGRFDAQGSLKIFPIGKSTEIMMLNKTDWERFSQETGAELSTLATMEGVAATAEQYYNWSGGKAFFGRDAVANYFIIGCKQLGVEIFSVKDGAVTLQCDKAVLRRLWDSFYVPFVNGWFTAKGRFRSDDAKTGDIIALVCSTSGAAYFPTEVSVSDTESYPIESIALPTPLFEGAKPTAVQQGAGMVVTKGTPAQEYASVVFLKWFTEAERNIGFSTSSGYLPVKSAANDIALLETTLTSLEPSPVTSNLKLCLPVAVETVKSHELYTSKAFLGGTQARAVLEQHMMEQITADLAEVEALVAGGATRAEAAAQFTTDEHFESWFTAFEQALAAAVQ